MAYLDAITRLGPGGGPRAQYVGFAASASASITAGALTEAQIVAGGQTIVITLVGDTFVAFNDTIRQAIIDGLDSAQSELLGWNNEVRDKEVVGAVVRDSDTQVTITLTAANYDITADETITVTIPASALTGAVELAGSPTVTVTNETPLSAVVGGHFGDDERRKRKYDDQLELRRLIEEAAGLLEQAEVIAEEIPEPVKTETVQPIAKPVFKSQVADLREELEVLKVQASEYRTVDMEASKAAIRGIIARSVNDIIGQIAHVLSELIQEIVDDSR